MSEVPTPIRLRLCIEDVLRSRIPLLDGVDKLVTLARDVPVLTGDRDLAKLVQILSDHEHLPIGASRQRRTRSSSGSIAATTDASGSTGADS